MFEYLEKIDNGSLKTAHRMSYNGLIGNCVDRGYIDAKQEGDLFTNMSLNESGENMLRLSKSTVEDNPCTKNSVREWLRKPFISASFKYLLLGFLALMAGAYSSDIKDMISFEDVRKNIKSKD